MTQLHLDGSLNLAYLDQLAELNRINFQEDVTDQDILRAEKFPQLYTILRRGNDVRGFGVIFPLKASAYEGMITGQMWENEIRLGDIDPNNPAGIYLAAIASSQDATYRERAMLVGATVGPLLRVPQDIFAVAVSQAGDKICRMIHMQPRWSSLTLNGLDGFTPQMFSSS